jgi:membrane protease YdiL (CAAX protease family)
MAAGDKVALRDRLGALLGGNRIVAAIELSVVPICLGLQYAGLSAKPKLPLPLFGWLSLWLRRVGWKRVGLARPTRWPATVLAALLLSAAYNLFDIRVLIPLLHRLTGEPLDLTQLGALHGQLGTALLLIAASWISAALPEEMLYRGYFLNRLTDALGRGRLRSAPGVLLVAVAFGFAHHAQGLTGILDNAIAGLFFGILYVASGRNLWLPIFVHGVVDTSSVILLYLGFRP